MSATTIDVFTDNFGSVFRVPPQRIVHAPGARNRARARLVLCEQYQHVQTGCSHGDRCRFVHCDVTGLHKVRVHVNYAWPSLAAVTWPRYSDATPLPVLAPNSNDVVDMIPPCEMLVTKALAAHPRRKLSHCAHYFFNRTCTLGHDCLFVHAVYVDLQANAPYLAPGPSQIEGRAPVMSLRQRRSAGSTEASESVHMSRSTSSSWSFTAAVTPAEAPVVAVRVRRHNPYADCVFRPL